MNAPTIDHARRILELAPQGLSHGVGKPIPGHMCIEALVCFVLGQEHGDSPACVHAADRAYKININDATGWRSPQERGEALARIGVMQLGTAGTDRREWAKKLAELTIRRVLPIALKAAAWRFPSGAAALLAAAELCERLGTREAALEAKKAAAAAYATYATYAAAYAAYAADAYAAADAAYAAYAAADAADAYAADAARKQARVMVLRVSIECAEQAYRETGSQGTEFLREIEEGSR